MNKRQNNKKSTFEVFLKSSMTAIDFENIPLTLGISKKMFTIILRNPKKLGVSQIKRLSEIIKKPLENIAEFID